MKKLTRKEIGLSNRPWITNGILTSMKKRDSLYREFTLENDQAKRNEIFMSYKQYRNNIVNLIRVSKKDHFAKYFEENRSNIKKTWEGIRDIINISKKTSTIINKINDCGNISKDGAGIANAMNNFFVNIGASVEAKIPDVDKSFSSYLGERKNFSFRVNNVTEDDVVMIIKNLSKGKASGPFSIPISILKNFSTNLSGPLTCIINKSLGSGIFPSLLKYASLSNF